MLFTPWPPHLNLPGRTRLQRPAYKELIEAGTLPKFTDTPTATAKQKQKRSSSRCRVMSSSRQDVSAKRRFPENNLSRDLQLLLLVPQILALLFEPPSRLGIF